MVERAKFLAIFAANLDEFFMKRIAVLREALTPEQLKLLEQIRAKLVHMLHRQAECFRGGIVPALANHRKLDEPLLSFTARLLVARLPSCRARDSSVITSAR